MKQPNRVNLLIAVIFILLIGWILFIILNQDYSYRPAESDFRTWFWEKRGLDLIVQVLLVFAGVLGIAAILPVEDEDD